MLNSWKACEKPASWREACEMYSSLRVKGKKPFKCMLLRRKTWIWNTFRGNPAPSPRIKGKTDEDARVLLLSRSLVGA